MSGYLSSLIKFLVFTVVTVLFTAILAATIANTNFGDMSGYTARFANVSGLKPGDDVRISGVKVGQVTAIEVAEDNIADVRFDIDTEHRIPDTVTATVKYRNVIGQRYLALGTHVDSPEPLPQGGVIPVERTHPALNLTVLFNGFKPLFQALDPAEINQLSFEIIQVFQGEGSTINSLLSHTASLTSTIADKDEVIGKVITNLNDVLGTINERGPQTKELIDSLQALVTGLAEKRKPIGEAAEALGGLTESVSGLVSDARPPLRDNIDSLGKLSRNLNDSEEVIDKVLKALPKNLAKFTRVLSYGSWYNFYLCSISGTIGIESLNITLPITPPPGTERPERCGP
ncbi:MAG: MCE family protein [Haloechinothrix sp.]